MMKEWTCRGRGILMGASTAGALSTGDAALITHEHNLVVLRANWLELVAMAQMRGVLLSHDRLDNQGPVRGYILTGLVDQKCIEIAKWSGTIADGHSHAAELAKALGLTEGGGQCFQ